MFRQSMKICVGPSHSVVVRNRRVWCIAIIGCFVALVVFVQCWGCGYHNLLFFPNDFKFFLSWFE